MQIKRGTCNLEYVKLENKSSFFLPFSWVDSDESSTLLERFLANAFDLLELVSIDKITILGPIIYDGLGSNISETGNFFQNVDRSEVQVHTLRTGKDVLESLSFFDYFSEVE